ncbi:hypothetical protein [Bradyrhizobium sp. 150]|uniref:hypothetical protein n=1 Tax=Bradyrhizobium sp. 150 TaxID=2782625 RepID=UPI001FF9D0DA|nr:hypothetical protein [Bradyrhizobium sp. 150]MCK1670354.1 hypothetical protein [Bradyrhizobium sp. 150]
MKKYRIGKSVQLKAKPQCRDCGELLDGATGVGANRPRPGNVSVCFYCGHISVFADDLSLREPNGEEMREIADNETILAIQRARRKLKQ